MAALIFLVLSIIQVCLNENRVWSELQIPITLIGVAGIWGYYDALVRKDFVLNEHRWLATACSFTFFIYLFHVPTINIVRKLIVAVIGKTTIGYIVSYLASPWIFAAVAVLVGIVLRRYLGKVYLICTGGR